MAGVPKDLLNEYPALKAFRNRIASEPAIKAYYAKVTDASRDAFKADA